MQVLAACEDLPEEHNRVTLDPALTDSDGIPAPKITYRLSENTRRMLAHGLERGRELTRAAGAVELLETPLLPARGWRLLGPARMGRHPARPVVTPSGPDRKTAPQGTRVSARLGIRWRRVLKNKQQRT